jgi:hypothetical protein
MIRQRAGWCDLLLVNLHEWSLPREPGAVGGWRAGSRCHAPFQMLDIWLRRLRIVRPLAGALLRRGGSATLTIAKNAERLTMPS